MHLFLAATFLATVLAAGTAKAVPCTDGTAKAVPYEAHEKFKIVGTVVKVHAEQLDVKALDGATYEMDMFESAAIFRRNSKVARTELKPGVKVTVNALGHDFFDLEVVEVHIAD